MAYYRGDYYRGDPGLFGFLGRTIKGAATGFITGGPLGAIGGAIKSNIPGRSPVRSFRGTITNYAPPPTAPARMPARAQIAATMPKTVSIDPATGMPRAKRRRMNVANPKALRRAIRREQGFVKLARKALKGTGYRVTTAASRRPAPRISERGPGSVHVH